MSHAIAFALCLAGFVSLAFAMRRQQRDLIGRFLLASTTYVLRALGTFTLLSALAVLVVWHGWSLGLVMFSGHTSVASGLVLCSLIVYSRMDARTSQHRHRTGSKALS